MSNILKRILVLVMVILIREAGAQVTTVSLPVTSITAGSTVNIPVTIDNLGYFGAITLKIQYSATALSFLGTANWNAAISGSSPAAQVNSGSVVIVWESLSPAFINSGKLVDLQFTYAGGNSGLDFVTSQCEIADSTGEILPVSFVNGRVEQLLLIPPTLMYPANNAVNQSVSSLLQWHSVPTAVKYQLQVSKNSDFSTYEMNDTSLVDTSKLVNLFLHNSQYYWRVRGKGPLGWGNWPAAFSFSTLSGINLNIKTFIEGLYDTTLHKMRIGDTISVELYTSGNLNSRVDSSRCYLTAEGITTAKFGIANSGYYYIVLHHRNALSTWSGYNMHLIKGMTDEYDFSLSPDQAFGENQIVLDSVSCIYSGDVNRDGVIDLGDLILIDNAANTMLTGYIGSDIDGNGVVNLVDMQRVSENSMNFISVKKP